MEKQKMSVLAELKNLTSERYVLSIDADTTVYEDDYQNGEGSCVNSWENSKKVFKTTSDKISTELSIALKEYIENELKQTLHLYFSFPTTHPVQTKMDELYNHHNS